MAKKKKIKTTVKSETKEIKKAPLTSASPTVTVKTAAANSARQKAYVIRKRAAGYRRKYIWVPPGGAEMYEKSVRALNKKFSTL